MINAIAHADYSLTGMRIMVAIFSDRLEIQNPGILPFGMTIESFKAGASMVRNRTIAKVLRQLSLMEEWGSGYHRIMTACSEEGAPLPEWEEIGPVIRVTFAPHPQTTTVPVESINGNVPVNVPVNERQQWFLDQLRQGVRCGPAEVAARWDVVLKTAKRDITDLRKKDLITFVGPPKTGWYQLK